MDIEVTIERLVLDGLDLEPGGAGTLAAALQGELSRQLTAAAAQGRQHTGRPAFSPADAASLALPPVPAPAGTGPELLGRRIGATLAGGLNHG